ncbi:MAG: GMC family oxidoreductase N-terminal domain-containing protein [Proteobacteria bacterium]|nr:GMC family oxidoreductase N-terminal domain-containing protein [Pseudomonadota bacterium]
MGTDSSKKYDVIIVGSGPGGASVARELSRTGKKILMLEMGDNAPIKGSLFQMAMNAGIPGQSLLFTDKSLLAMVRGVCTGGSSVFYCATAFDPPYGMLDSYGIDVREEVKELKQEIPMEPTRDHLMGVGATRIMESALNLGYDWKKLNKFIDQDKCKIDCDKCSYGCPYGAKWTARNFVEESTKEGMDLVNGAKVTRILFEGDTAVGVRYRKNFSDHEVFADTIVVSAGGVGSPEILRQSGLYQAGYDFFFDPLTMIFGTVDDLKSKGEIQMSAGFHNTEKGYLMVDLNFPTPMYWAQSLPKLRLHKAFSRDNTLMIMIKIKDALGGRITWNGGVRKSISDADKNKLKDGYTHAKRILQNAGATGIFSGWTVAAHPGGTVKINDMLDSNLKTQKENLYVCDCSVIPEAWGLPPTLTLLALGKRLARHLETRM